MDGWIGLLNDGLAELDWTIESDWLVVILRHSSCKRIGPECDKLHDDEVVLQLDPASHCRWRFGRCDQDI